MALWLDEALHDPLVTEDKFGEMVERYGKVMRRLKQVGTKGEVGGVKFFCRRRL